MPPRSRRVPAETTAPAPWHRARLHPFAAASGRRLDQNRKSKPLRISERFANLGDALPIAAGQDRNTGALHDAARARLVAHQANMPGAGPHELEAGSMACFSEIAVLRKKSIARMDRVRAVGKSGAEDGGDA